MQILEFFHCGPDRAARLYPIDDLTATTVARALRDSPHVKVDTNPQAAQAIGNLVGQAEGEMGWCRYWIVPSVGDTVEMEVHRIGGQYDLVTGTVIAERVINERCTPTWEVKTDNHGTLMWSTSNGTPKRVIANVHNN